MTKTPHGFLVSESYYGIFRTPMTKPVGRAEMADIGASFE